jgi:hypothetical protein
MHWDPIYAVYQFGNWNICSSFCRASLVTRRQWTMCAWFGIRVLLWYARDLTSPQGLKMKAFDCLGTFQFEI